MKWTSVLLLVSAVGCKSTPPLPVMTPDDGPVVQMDQAAAGLYQNCTPLDVPCQPGLRCALVMVGEAPYQSFLTQCVPYAPEALPLMSSCQFDAALPQPAGSDKKWVDRCGPGLGCVPTVLQGSQCLPLCALRVGGTCPAGSLCVLPSPVSTVGYCQVPDGCQAVTPQSGCPASISGVTVSCYALADKTGGGTYCLPRRMLGGSSGASGAICERSVDCAAGLGCVTVGAGTRCQPYCALPPLPPDGGGAADLGPVPCTSDLGICAPLGTPGVDRVGACH